MWPFKKKDTGPNWCELIEEAERECYLKTLTYLEIKDWNLRLRGSDHIRDIMIGEGVKFPCYERLKEHPKQKKAEAQATYNAQRWMKEEEELKEAMRQEIKDSQSTK